MGSAHDLLNKTQGSTHMQRFTSRLLRSSVPLLALAGLAACGSLPGAHSAAGESVTIPATAAAPPMDNDITQSVRTNLARELPLAEISVQTAQGKVQLRGTVEDTDAARRAVKGALAVEGVRGVVNDLNVSPEASGRGAALAASTL